MKRFVKKYMLILYNSTIKLKNRKNLLCLNNFEIFSSYLDDYASLLVKFVIVFVELQVCIPSPCKNGTCGWKSEAYFCLCDEGYTGKNCDKGEKLLRLVIFELLVVVLIIYLGLMQIKAVVLRNMEEF